MTSHYIYMQQSTLTSQTKNHIDRWVWVQDDIREPTGCTGSTLAQNARDVSLSPAPGTIFPIFITPTTYICCISHYTSIIRPEAPFSSHPRYALVIYCRGILLQHSISLLQGAPPHCVLLLCIYKCTYSKTSLTIHIHRLTTYLYRSFYLGPR